MHLASLVKFKPGSIASDELNIGSDEDEGWRLLFFKGRRYAGLMHCWAGYMRKNYTIPSFQWNCGLDVPTHAAKYC